MDGDEWDSSDNLGHTIILLRPYIVERVTIAHLVPLMPCMRNVLSKISNTTDPQNVADIFFSHLRELDDPGKYKALLTALERANYPLVVSVINDGSMSGIDDENRRLIELFLKRLADVISPDIMSEELQQREIIEPHEGEKIRNLASKESTLDAALYLLSRIHCRKSTWYEEFLEILWDMDHRILVKDMDEKFYIKKTGENLDSSLSPTSFNAPEPSFPPHAVSKDKTGTALMQVSPSPRQSFEMDTSQARFQSPPQQREPVLELQQSGATSADVRLMESVLVQLSAMSAQLTQQTNSIGHITSRLDGLEIKVDQILEKLSSSGGSR